MTELKPAETKSEVLAKYNRLTILSVAGKNKRGLPLWLCRCDCGKEVVILRASIRRGATKSCGCYGTEMRKKTYHIHGLSKIHKKEYACWKHIIGRCRDINHKFYSYYGGRGINISEEFMNFETFFTEIGQAPTKKHTLDRIENSKGYERGNLRWATMAEQSFNKRNNVFLTYLGRTQAIGQWAKELNMNKATLGYRVKKYPIHIAFTKQIKYDTRRNKTIT